MTQDQFCGIVLIFASLLNFLFSIHGLQQQSRRQMAFAFGVMYIPIAIYYFSK